MTREQAKKLLSDPSFIAYAEGKEVEYECCGSWCPVTDGSTFTAFSYRGHQNHRIKPSPTLRPWKPEEVPVGALIRFEQASCIGGKYLIVASDKFGIVHSSTADTPYLNKVRYEQLNRCEYSLDHGKTWQPCGVYET